MSNKTKVRQHIRIKIVSDHNGSVISSQIHKYMISSEVACHSLYSVFVPKLPEGKQYSICHVYKRFSFSILQIKYWALGTIFKFSSHENGGIPQNTKLTQTAKPNFWPTKIRIARATFQNNVASFSLSYTFQQTCIIFLLNDLTKISSFLCIVISVKSRCLLRLPRRFHVSCRFCWLCSYAYFVKLSLFCS